MVTALLTKIILSVINLLTHMAWKCLIIIPQVFKCDIFTGVEPGLEDPFRKKEALSTQI